MTESDDSNDGSNQDKFRDVLPESEAKEKILFTHYGLHWSECNVFWSTSKKKKGGLRGVEKRSKKSEEGRDFNDYIGIYCLYDGTRLLYVGEAGLGNSSTIYNRLSHHRSDHLADAWDEFSWFGREKTSNDAVSKTIQSFQQLEALLIAVTDPGSNKQSGTFGGAMQFFQAIHSEAEGDLNAKITRVTVQLEELRAREKVQLPKPKRGPKPKGV